MDFTIPTSRFPMTGLTVGSTCPSGTTYGYTDVSGYLQICPPKGIALPAIEKVVFVKLATKQTKTIVFWEDGEHTSVTTILGETFTEDGGVAQCIAKRYFDEQRCCENAPSVFKQVLAEAIYSADGVSKSKPKKPNRIPEVE